MSLEVKFSAGSKYFLRLLCLSSVLGKGSLTLFLLMMIQEAYVDSVGLDQTTQNVQSDL